MSDFYAYLASIALLGIAGYRFLATHGTPTDSVMRAVYGFTLCEGLSLALLAPATPETLPWAYITAPALVLLGDGLRTAGLSFLVLLAHSLSAPPPSGRRSRDRRRIATAVLVQVTMLSLYAAARPKIRSGSLVVHGDTGGWLIAAHDIVFAVYALCCLYALIGALAQHAARLGPGPIQLGLRLSMAATAIGMLWTSWTLDDVIDVVRTGIQNGAEDVVSNLFASTCAALIVGALAVTLGAQALAAPARWRQSYHRYRALGPLWSALHSAVPEIALTSTARRHYIEFRSTEFALYRRIIEIRDGHLALRPYFQPETSAWVAETLCADRPDTQSYRAIVEAATIVAALENKRTGRRLGRSQEAAPTTQPVPGTVDAEADWLLEVTDAFVHSPVMAHVRHRLRDAEDGCATRNEAARSDQTCPKR